MIIVIIIIVIVQNAIYHHCCIFSQRLLFLIVFDCTACYLNSMFGRMIAMNDQVIKEAEQMDNTYKPIENIIIHWYLICYCGCCMYQCDITELVL